jgi:thymidylate synthase
MFLGVLFNIASYAMLTQVIEEQTNLKPRRFVHTFGYSHFYTGTGKRSEWYI